MSATHRQPNVWIADEITLEKYPELATLEHDGLPLSRWHAMRNTNLLACIGVYYLTFWALRSASRWLVDPRADAWLAQTAMVFLIASIVVVPILTAFLVYRPLLRWRLRRLQRAASPS